MNDSDRTQIGDIVKAALAEERDHTRIIVREEIATHTSQCALVRSNTSGKVTIKALLVLIGVGGVAGVFGSTAKNWVVHFLQVGGAR